MEKMLAAVVAITAVAMPAYAADTWWQLGGYMAGCVTESRDAVLRDHGDYVDIINPGRFPLAGGKEIMVYRFFRSKDICLQHAAAADKELHEFFGALKKQDAEEHPNLDQYRRPPAQPSNSSRKASHCAAPGGGHRIDGGFGARLGDKVR